MNVKIQAPALSGTQEKVQGILIDIVNNNRNDSLIRIGMTLIKYVLNSCLVDRENYHVIIHATGEPGSYGEIKVFYRELGYQDTKMMIGSLLNILSTQDKDSLCIDDINRVCCLIQELLPSDDQMLLLDRIDTGWCEIKKIEKKPNEMTR